MNKRSHKTFRYFSVFLLFIGTPIYAAPVISGVAGNTVDDSTITITSSGTNFGIGPSSTEWLGGKTGPIESGTNNAIFKRTNWITDGNNPWPENLPVYSSSQAHSGAKSLYCNPNSSSWNSILDYRLPTPVSTTGKLFISQWVRITPSGSGQWKMNRFTSKNTIVDGTNQLVLFSWSNGYGTQLCVDPTEVTYTGLNVSPISTTSTWMRVDQYIQAGTSKGSYTISKYVPGVSRQTQTVSSYPTHRSGGSWNYIIWQNYAGNGMSSAAIYIDDVYISNGSQARVEIGEASTYSMCKHLEIQPVSAWNSSSITAKVNKGSFGASSTAYLFVIDSDGNASSGYPIQFGSSVGTTPADTTPPARPSGITVDVIP